VLLFRVHRPHRIRGDQYLATGQPGSRVGDQIANRPVLVVEVEFLDLADFPVAAVQGVPLEGLGFAKHIRLLDFPVSN
jgi:hypothetical protein